MPHHDLSLQLDFSPWQRLGEVLLKFFYAPLKATSLWIFHSIFLVPMCNPSVEYDGFYRADPVYTFFFEIMFSLVSPLILVRSWDIEMCFFPERSEYLTQLMYNCCVFRCNILLFGNWWTHRTLHGLIWSKGDKKWSISTCTHTWFVGGTQILFRLSFQSIFFALNIFGTTFTRF